MLENRDINNAMELKMQAFYQAQDLISANKLTNPSDFYRALLTVKNGFENGVTKLGCYVITKTEAKKAGIDWAFIQQSVEVLGLKITNRAGRYGH